MMRMLHVPTLFGVWVGAAGLSWLVLMLAESRGKYLPAVPWLAYLVIVALIVVVLRYGLRVRAYLKGRRPNLSALVAARTLSLAQSSAWGGVLLSGWYAGQVLVTVGDWGFEARQVTAIAALIAAGLALLLSAAGVIVERWCRLSGDADDGPVHGQQVEQ